MLVGNSLPEYVSIRTVIAGLRLITPLSSAYCFFFLLVRPDGLRRYRLPLPVEIWLVSETAFLLLGYLPLKIWRQQAAVHPLPLERQDRKILIHRCLESTPNLERFLSKWHLDAPLEDIKRENVKEFFAWSLMNRSYEGIREEDSAELDIYVDSLERKYGHPLKPGRGKARCLRGTLDPVPMQHRPLIWYGTVFSVDCLSCARLLISGYAFYRLHLAKAFTNFPVRLVPFISLKTSAAPSTTYWYRKHTSKTKLPILFIHGIGIGLFAYVDFLIELAKACTDPEEGNVGIIALELMPISSRICSPALAASVMRREITTILDSHGWDDFVLIGHSYGSAIAANVLRDDHLRPRIKAAILMDPICFLLHLPDVAYNFTRREPRQANEYMLHYFSSEDMMISHTLARHFFWSEYTLWKEDITGLPLTVTLSGQDLIVPTEAVWKYLTSDSAPGSAALDTESTTQKDAEWREDTLVVLWFDKFDHAGLFTSRGARRGLARTAWQYSNPGA